MLRKSSPPIEPRRREAPITATEARLEERLERGGDGDVVALVDALLVARGRRDREAHLDLAALELARDLEAGVGEDREHRPVLGQHLGDEALDPGARPRRGELLEQARADAAALQLVGDGEGHLGRGGLAQPHVARERDDALLARSPSAPTSAPRSSQSGSSTARRARGPSPEAVEAQVEARSESPAKNSTSASASAACGGRSRSVPPSRRMTSRSSVTALILYSILRPAPALESGRAPVFLRFFRSARQPAVAAAKRPSTTGQPSA